MSLLAKVAQRAISAFLVHVSRSSAVANVNNGLGPVGGVDMVIQAPNGNITHRANEYVLTRPPTDDIIPNPKIGDKARVFYVDDERSDNPYAYDEFIYTRNVTNLETGAVATGDPVWRRVTSA